MSSEAFDANHCEVLRHNLELMDGACRAHWTEVEQEIHRFVTTPDNQGNLHRVFAALSTALGREASRHACYRDAAIEAIVAVEDLLAARETQQETSHE
jgi:hypothetical protein